MYCYVCRLYRERWVVPPFSPHSLSNSHMYPLKASHVRLYVQALQGALAGALPPTCFEGRGSYQVAWQSPQMFLLHHSPY